jgi:hypothetical protein
MVKGDVAASPHAGQFAPSLSPSPWQATGPVIQKRGTAHSFHHGRPPGLPSSRRAPAPAEAGVGAANDSARSLRESSRADARDWMAGTKPCHGEGRCCGVASRRAVRPVTPTFTMAGHRGRHPKAGHRTFISPWQATGPAIQPPRACAANDSARSLRESSRADARDWMPGTKPCHGERGCCGVASRRAVRPVAPSFTTACPVSFRGERGERRFHFHHGLDARGLRHRCARLTESPIPAGGSCAMRPCR